MKPRKVQKIIQEFESLYSELIIFKDKKDFKRYGFGAGGCYNEWLKNTERLKTNPDSKLLLKKGVAVGELVQLGLEYVSSNGKETEITIILQQNFLKCNITKNNK